MPRKVYNLLVDDFRANKIKIEIRHEVMKFKDLTSPSFRWQTHYLRYLYL